MFDMLICYLQLKNRIFFSDVQIIREDNTFTTSVYRKSTFIGVHTHFDSFYHLPISLVLFTDLLIDASGYTQVGLNYAPNYFFLKMTPLNIV